ncbi:HDIG domain-containing protein, partial [bacterium]|nr:HDIG domain-containing protein [bacterium]
MNSTTAGLIGLIVGAAGVFALLRRELLAVRRGKVEAFLAEVQAAKAELTRQRKETAAERAEADASRASLAQEREEMSDEAQALASDRERLEAARRDAAEEAARSGRELADRERRLLADEAKMAARMEDLAGMDAKAARKLVLDHARRASREALAAIAKEGEREADEQARDRGVHALLAAVQRVKLPQAMGDDMLARVAIGDESLKGRIIGKAGRNVRYFQEQAGVDLIIDDTPGVVTVSSFDGERRAVAALALERLVADGRIHAPAIDRELAAARDEVAQLVARRGRDAAEQAGVPGLAAEVLDTMGRLSLRTSYGQNMLAHSVECARIATALAAELGRDPALLRRMAYLHDIGKALPADRDVKPHALAGAQFLRRHGESPVVCNGVASHHGEEAPTSVDAALVRVVDTLSSAR